MNETQQADEHIKEFKKFLKWQTKNTLINLLIKASIANKYLENKLKELQPKAPSPEEEILNEAQN